MNNFPNRYGGSNCPPTSNRDLMANAAAARARGSRNTSQSLPLAQTNAASRWGSTSACPLGTRRTRQTSQTRAATSSASRTNSQNANTETLRPLNNQGHSQARRRTGQSTSTNPSSRPQVSLNQESRQKPSHRTGTAPATAETQKDSNTRSNHSLSRSTQQALSLRAHPNPQGFTHRPYLRKCCLNCDPFDNRPSSHIGNHIWRSDGYCLGSPHQILSAWPLDRAELESLPR
ncbi:hypothetical protein E2P81_ATG05215 [Venturia nashicola]|nr:hypothetical protein E2P81_ATG05215 [Venturia nashicola]